MVVNDLSKLYCCLLYCCFAQLFLLLSLTHSRHCYHFVLLYCFFCRCSSNVVLFFSCCCSCSCCCYGCQWCAVVIFFFVVVRRSSFIVIRLSPSSPSCGYHGVLLLFRVVLSCFVLFSVVSRCFVLFCIVVVVVSHCCWCCSCPCSCCVAFNLLSTTLVD